MSIELPCVEHRNLLVIDYLLNHCSLEALVKYFESEDSSVTALVQRNTRFCSLLAKYLRSMQKRQNIGYSFNHGIKPRLKNEAMEIAERVYHQAMECDDIVPKNERFEMYATLQVCNVKQSFYDTRFQLLLHIGIPASARNDNLDCTTISFQPNSTFLIDSIDVTLSIEKCSSRVTTFTMHEMPTIRWSRFAAEKKAKEEIIVRIDSLSYGQRASNACSKQFIATNQCLPTKLQCREWQGNYLVAISIECRREFAR